MFVVPKNNNMKTDFTYPDQGGFSKEGSYCPAAFVDETLVGILIL